MSKPVIPLPPNDGMRIDFSSRAPQILAGVIIPFGIASLFVAGRLYARAIIVRSWGSDDTIVVLSWILGLGVTIVASVSTRYGGGHHQDAIPFQSAVPALQLEYANLLLYQAAVVSIKISICLFYLRLFSDHKSRYLIFGTMIWIVAYFMPCEMIDAFQCDPISGIWNKTTPSKCINNGPCFYTMAVCNIVGDAWLICIVAPKLWPLKMPRRQKIALMCVITSGWLVIVAAILRVVRISRSHGSSDRSWIYYDTAIWSGLEISVGLFCVSAPAIKPLLLRYLPGLVASFSQSQSCSFPDNRYNTHNYIKSNGRQGTVTYVNGGASRDASQAEAGLELQDLDGSEGKAVDGDSNKPTSKTGNRTFWWDRKNGGSDTESMEEIVAKPQSPVTGIMKVTSVTVSVEDSKMSQDVQRGRSGSTRRNSLMDRGGAGLSIDRAETWEKL